MSALPAFAAPAVQQAPTPTTIAPPAPQPRTEVVRVESATAGRWPADEATQAKVCLLADGRLLVAHNQRLDPLVQQYEAALKAARHPYRVEYVGIADLRQHYQDAALQGSVKVVQASESDRQQKIITLVQQAARMGASDMHFIVGRDLGEVRYRINGLLETPKGNQMDRDEVSSLIATIYQSMLDAASAPVYNPLVPQDGRVDQKFIAAAGLHGIRTATRPTDRGQIGILRLFAGGKRRSLEELGYLTEQVEMMRRMAQRRVGINILAGATGSGKSTTMAAVYDLQVRHFQSQLHIMTIEDPVEATIAGVNHTPVDRKSDGEPNWFASIKSSMRCDPDVIGIGEIRDGVSAIAAFEAAQTGHSVWATLHANDAFAILMRLLKLGVDEGLLYDPSLLALLCSQSLAPTLCQHCKIPWHQRPKSYDADTAARLESVCDTANVCVAVGCDHCRHSGAGGRTLLAELVETNLDLFRTVRKRGKAEARAEWISKGGITKTAHLIRRVSEGLIDPMHAEAAVSPLDYDKHTVAWENSND